jgi:hypothetical protein
MPQETLPVRKIRDGCGRVPPVCPNARLRPTRGLSATATGDCIRRARARLAASPRIEAHEAILIRDDGADANAIDHAVSGPRLRSRNFFEFF